MMLGAQFLAPLRHRLEALTQIVAIGQGQAQRDDGGEGKDGRSRRREERRVEQDFEEAGAEHVRLSS